VSVVSFGLGLDDLEELPSAEVLLQWPDEKIEPVLDQVKYETIASGQERDGLDWEHIHDLQAQHPAMKEFFAWIARCLRDQISEAGSGQVRRRSGRIRKDRVVARDQKVRHFIKLSTSQPAYVLLKPYCACRSITRSLLFLKADTSCSDNLFHLCRISSRMIRRLWDGGAVIAGSMVIGFAPMGGPIQGTEARFTVGDYR
jgi:hypothetical protein